MPKLTTTTTVTNSQRVEAGGYPYYTLAACLKLGEAVKKAGGREVPKAVIAEELQADAGASSFAQLCSSAKTFGIVDGSRSLGLTEAGRDYFYPTSDAAARLALLEFFSSPPAFQYLISRFDGRMIPAVSMMANLLHRERHIPESWSGRAAGLFVSAADEAGAKDQQGYLRFESTRHGLGRGSTSLTPTVVEGNTSTSAVDVLSPPLSTGTSFAAPLAAAIATNANVWVYSESGASVRLETPEKMPMALWERLRRYVEVLKPND